LLYLLKVLFIRGLVDETVITKGKYIIKALIKHKSMATLSGVNKKYNLPVSDGEVRPDFKSVIAFREQFKKLNNKELDEHHGIGNMMAIITTKVKPKRRKIVKSKVREIDTDAIAEASKKIIDETKMC